MKNIVLLLFLMPILYSGCLKAPEYPIEPIINLIGISSDVMKQDNFNSDSIVIVFGFTDGDGDLGDNDSVNIFLIDERIGISAGTFKIPLLSQSAGAKGISGEIAVRVYSTCCLFPNGQPPCTTSTEFPVDSLVYSIYIEDRADHKSNVIFTPPIKLLCQ